MKLLLPVLAVLVALHCAACGHTLQLQANVIEPAGIPVRAFPNVWVERGELLAEQELATQLVTYLQATPRMNVRLVDGDQLAAARAGGTVTPATVVVIFRLHTRELSRVEWTTRPETVCDALGCFTVARSYNYDVPVIDGELRISVQDGQTSQELQRAVVRAREEGRDYEDMLPRLTTTLGERLHQLTEQRIARVQVTLLEVSNSTVERALSLAEAGQWSDARDLLERFVSSDGFSSLQRLERARVLYDLAQARRFGARDGESVLELLQRARESANAAFELDPESRYARAVHEIDTAIKTRRMVDDQRAAAEHNFAIEAARTSTPPPISPSAPSGTEPATSTSTPTATDAVPETP